MHRDLARLAPAVVAAVAALAPASSAQTLQPPFAALYSIANVGGIPGLPGTHGAITFDRDNPNVLLCSAWNTTGVQNLYGIRVVRDPQGHITGFSGTASPRAQLDRIDGGLDHHPSGVLFYTRYASVFTPPDHGVGQLRPGSTAPDRVDAVLGPATVGGLAIVPQGLPGAGRLKTLRWPGGEWVDATLTPDGSGRFTIGNEQQLATLPGGPDGFCYVPRMAPLLNGSDVLVAEFNTGTLATYLVDAQGDPVVGTRQVFATGVTSAFALAVDPVTLDVVHASWSGNTVHVIRGFALPCGQCSNYGTGLGGTNGRIPRILGLGCALAGEQAGVHVGEALPGAIGVLAVGLSPQAIPVFGGTLLNDAVLLLTIAIGPTGNHTLPLALPPGVGGNTLYFQAGILDPGAPQDFALTNGLAMPVN